MQYIANFGLRIPPEAPQLHHTIHMVSPTTFRIKHKLALKLTLRFPVKAVHAYIMTEFTLFGRNFRSSVCDWSTVGFIQ